MKLWTGPSWRDVPERYGSWKTLYTRFRRWALDGTFSRMLRAIQAEKDAAPQDPRPPAQTRHPAHPVVWEFARGSDRLIRIPEVTARPAVAELGPAVSH
ncbi:transposase [Kitasatospora sp. NBC_01560]|uniref:transposase n=1 Tax=Kitasatospora sp. NBC_01560 TaxID=2975965 RepID=UPI003868F011